MLNKYVTSRGWVVLIETGSGEAKGRACRAKHDQNFFKLIFSSVSILQVNIYFYVDRIFDLILAKTRTLYLIVCSAFDAL